MPATSGLRALSYDCFNNAIIRRNTFYRNICSTNFVIFVYFKILYNEGRLLRKKTAKLLCSLVIYPISFYLIFHIKYTVCVEKLHTSYLAH